MRKLFLTILAILCISLTTFAQLGFLSETRVIKKYNSTTEQFVEIGRDHTESIILINKGKIGVETEVGGVRKIFIFTATAPASQNETMMIVPIQEENGPKGKFIAVRKGDQILYMAIIQDQTVIYFQDLTQQDLSDVEKLNG